MNNENKEIKFNELLDQMIRYRGLTIYTFSSFIGFSQHYVFELLQGTKKPSALFLDRVCERFDFSKKARATLFRVAGIKERLPKEIECFLRENEEIYKMVEYEYQSMILKQEMEESDIINYTEPPKR